MRLYAYVYVFIVINKCFLFCSKLKWKRENYLWFHTRENHFSNQNIRRIEHFDKLCLFLILSLESQTNIFRTVRFSHICPVIDILEIVVKHKK